MPVPGVATQVVGGLLGRVKSSGILLGIAYLIAFVFTLPYALAVSGGTGVTGDLLIGLAAVVAIVVVQILLNWMYVALVAAPALAAAILVSVGWAIWLAAPMVAIPVDLALKIVMGALTLGTISLGSTVTLAVDAATRFGQTLIALGGVFWWAVRRLGNANYIALGAFVTGIALLGILSGAVGLSGVAVFLVVWLMLYMRIKGDTNLPDLRRLFQVVASLAVIIGAQGLSIFNTLQLPQQFAYLASSQSTGAMQFAGIYRYVIMLLVLWGVWSPTSMWKAVPSPVRAAIQGWFKSASGLIRISA